MYKNLVLFALNHRGMCLSEYTDCIKKESWFKCDNECMREMYLALSCTVQNKLNGESRLTLWDFLFENILKDKEAYRYVINSYYSRKVDNKELYGIVSALYTYWHNTSYCTAIKGCLEDGYKKGDIALYLCASCASDVEIHSSGDIMCGEEWIDAYYI